MAYTTINKSTDYFNTKLYTGTGSELAITGVGFQPDWTWIKGRNVAYDNNVFDAVRGSTKRMMTNQTTAETTQAQMIKSFDSDGFTLGTDGGVNENNTRTYVAWNWKANGQGSSNTDGSINTTYTSANTTAGFSIIKYAGTGSSGTIGHGLSATPKVLIIKEIDGTESWRVWHRNAPNYSTKALSLDSNSAEFSQTNWIGTVDNSIITLGSDSSINTSGNNYICYSFADVQGYSKFGSYTGNSGNNADAPFIYTGFKPSFFLVKNTAQASAWEMYDNKRLGYNDANYQFRANESAGEGTTSDYVDFISNGMKIRHQGGGINETGDVFIYMAFAEAPLVGTNGVTAKAR